jgi:hypothetical protein
MVCALHCRVSAGGRRKLAPEIRSVISRIAPPGTNQLGDSGCRFDVRRPKRVPPDYRLRIRRKGQTHFAVSTMTGAYWRCMVKRVAVFALGILLLGAAQTNAETVTFENIAPPFSLINVDESFGVGGFAVFTTANPLSAIFDSAALSNMIGNTTDWFGFAPSNVITLSALGQPFGLMSLMIGPSTIGSGLSDISLIGTERDGTTRSALFAQLTTATVVTLNWSNLNSVEFRASDHAGLDNVEVAAPVPEPASMLLVAAGFLSGAARRWKRRTGDSVYGRCRTGVDGVGRPQTRPSWR